MKELLDPTVDYIFKNIFGVEKNKPVLLSFINALLKDKPHVKSITLDNTEIVKILKEDKTSRLDIKATCDDNTKLNIEIQTKNTGEIPERAIHYLANMFPSTVKAKQSYKQPKFISIWILGENVTDRKNAISEGYMTFQPYGCDPYQIVTDKARMFFIELPKFNPKDPEMSDLLKAWLSFLRDPTFMDTSFLRVQEVQQAMETLQYISADDEMRALADLRQKTINDKNSELAIAKEEGIAEGEAIGMEKGKRETALSMLNDGMPIETVSKYTGLSVEGICNISDSKK